MAAFFSGSCSRIVGAMQRSRMSWFTIMMTSSTLAAVHGSDGYRPARRPQNCVIACDCDSTSPSTSSCGTWPPPLSSPAARMARISSPLTRLSSKSMLPMVSARRAGSAGPWMSK